MNNLVHVVRQMATAVRYLHSVAVVHRHPATCVASSGVWGVWGVRGMRGGAWHKVMSSPTTF